LKFTKIKIYNKLYIFIIQIILNVKIKLEIYLKYFVSNQKSQNNKILVQILENFKFYINIIQNSLKYKLEEINVILERQITFTYLFTNYWHAWEFISCMRIYLL
jgi:hypothetical protein